MLPNYSSLSLWFSLLILQHITFLILFNIHAALSMESVPDIRQRDRFPFLSLAGGRICSFSALLRNLSGASCLTQISCLHSSRGLRWRRRGWEGGREPEGDPISMTTDVCISCGLTHHTRPLDQWVAVGRSEVERGLRVIKRSKWCCQWVTVSLELSHCTKHLEMFLLMAHLSKC